MKTLTIMTKPVYTLLLLLIITGCDGGILGTGDGGDPTIITTDDINSEGTSMTDGDTVDMPTGVDEIDGTDNTDTQDQTDATDSVDQLPSSAPDAAPFQNSTVINNRSDALLRLINTEVSDNDAIVANLQDPDTTLVGLPGLSQNTSTDYFSVPTDTPIIVELFYGEDVRASDFETPAYQSDPLTLSPGTLTTVIVRGNNSTVNGTTLDSVQTGLADDTVQPYLRVIHSAPTLALQGAIDIHWVDTSTLNTDGSADLTLNHTVIQNLTYNAITSDYRSLDSGTYTPVITAAGSTTVITAADSLFIDETGVFSIVMIDNTTGNGSSLVNALKIQDDSYP